MEMHYQLNTGAENDARNIISIILYLLFMTTGAIIGTVLAYKVIFHNFLPRQAPEPYPNELLRK